MPFGIRAKKNQTERNDSCKSLAEDGTMAIREEVVQTHKGPITVAVEGCMSKPAIITYHDLGLNHVSCFQTFFNYAEMRDLLKNFCVYHMNAPGQEQGAPTLPEYYVYPTMDELAIQIDFVLVHFNIKRFIGIGVGAGANILARYALINPEKVSALALINCSSTVAGWIEWGYQKRNAWYLRSKGMTQEVLDYLMWHHFGRNIVNRNVDIANAYTLYFEQNLNPTTNLALFMESYVQRNDLNIVRKIDPDKNVYCGTISTPILNITGAFSPHVEDTVVLNARLDPTNSSWMKISDCGMVLEEQPAKVFEAFKLFLQGEGYAINFKQPIVC